MTKGENADGLIFGCILDGKGGARETGWPDAEAWQNSDEPIWLHLEAENSEARRWKSTEAALARHVIDILHAPDTRPRAIAAVDSAIVILRGINSNENADPEDMVAMRMWCDGKRLITVRHRRLQTPRDILATLTREHNGPTSAPELFVRLIARLNERMAPTISGIDDAISDLEAAISEDDPRSVRQRLSETRLMVVNLRRYLAPQRDALLDLIANAPDWISTDLMHMLRESVDRVTRYVEELDNARERTIVLKDEATNQIAERSERRLYILAIISAIFLPLGFITGLLGINVGGLPGVDAPDAFFWVCVGLIVAVAVQLAVMRWLKWL